MIFLIIENSKEFTTTTLQQRTKEKAMTEAQTLTKGGLNEAAASIAQMDSAMSSFQRTTLNDLLTQQETLLNQQKEVAQLDDAKERAAKTEILNANLDSLQTKIAAYRDDTAELIAGLEAHFEKIGQSLAGLQKPTETDLSVVKRAEEFLKKVQDDGVIARKLLTDAVTEAQGAFFNSAGKTAEANQKLAAFDLQQEADVKAAGIAVEEAKAEVERARRKRIREADFDAQFDRFIAMAQQIQKNLLDNVMGSEVRMKETQNAFIVSLKQKESAALKMAEIAGKIREKENEVMNLESERGQTADEAARATVDVKLGVANQELADLNGQKQELQVAHNAEESAAKKHETILATLQVQRENQRSHAVKLSIDVKARFQQAQNIVTVIKNTAQEDAASRLHQAGSSMDRMSLEIAARALIASERERLNMLLNHEKDMKGFEEVRSTLAEGRADIAVRDAEIMARMRQDYGIDPLGSSWLHLAEQHVEEKKAA